MVQLLKVQTLVLRATFFKGQNRPWGQNLDHLHTPLSWRGWGDIKTEPTIFGPRCTYAATGWIIDFPLQEQKSHLWTLKTLFKQQ